MPLIWVIFMAKNFHNGTNIIAKHDTIFREKKSLNYSWCPW